MKKFVRDKRSPVPSSENASKTMSSIRAKNTKPELLFRKLLWQNGLRGYRLHWKVDGRPDIAFVGRKTAIFVHGCYWHRCPKCNPHTPRSNSNFWSNKFEKNVERDKRKRLALEKNGWKVFTFWECDIKASRESLVDDLKSHLTN